MGHQVDRRGSIIGVVVVGIVVAGGWRWVGLLGWERERDREGERDSETKREKGWKKINKKKNKNNKEIIFKWNVKKKKINKSFDIRYVVKWCAKCYKVGFLDAKC